MFIHVPERKKKPLKHLLNILRTTRDHHPNFTLLLGAGASATSGVKTAGKMIEEWRSAYVEMYVDASDPRTAIEAQTWYDKD